MLLTTCFIDLFAFVMSIDMPDAVPAPPRRVAGHVAGMDEYSSAKSEFSKTAINSATLSFGWKKDGFSRTSTSDRT